ncbi:MAG: hypothetical protein HQL52_05555 [Magnetococcales bacterium]|nr:hypothetical protein [Magnetococcales bacterium]
MDHSNNAMTEIALALAMGFFSIMILTLVSMGAGNGTVADGAALAQASASPANQSRSGVKPIDRMIIYHSGQFMDKELQPVDPAQVVPAEGERVVLALDPEIPMSEALAVRSQVPVGDLIVSALTPEWLAVLKEKSQ